MAVNVYIWCHLAIMIFPLHIHACAGLRSSRASAGHMHACQTRMSALEERDVDVRCMLEQTEAKYHEVGRHDMQPSRVFSHHRSRRGLESRSNIDYDRISQLENCVKITGDTLSDAERKYEEVGGVSASSSCHGDGCLYIASGGHRGHCCITMWGPMYEHVALFVNSWKAILSSVVCFCFQILASMLHFSKLIFITFLMISPYIFSFYQNISKCLNKEPSTKRSGSILY